jgi:hypothetical protein
LITEDNEQVRHALRICLDIEEKQKSISKRLLGSVWHWRGGLTDSGNGQERG